MRRHRLSVDCDDHRFVLSEIDAENAGVRGINEAEPNAFALVDREGLRHAPVDGYSVADTAIVTHVVRVAEIVADLAVGGQPPIVQNPCNVAINPDRRRFLDNQRPIKPTSHLFKTSLMGMVPEGAGVYGVELVGESTS